MRAAGRVVIATLAATVTFIAGSGRARAGLDDELSVTDANNRTMTVQQLDTMLDEVPPLDRNGLTREWFHSGKATYHVAGQAAEAFSGTLELGYQIGLPWTLGVSVQFRYTTPNVLFDKTSLTRRRIITPNLLPGVSFGADLGNGPGLQEIVTFSVDVAGPDGAVAISGAHGTASGVAGAVMLRPLARLIAKDGAVVTTYGEPSTIN